MVELLGGVFGAAAPWFPPWWVIKSTYLYVSILVSQVHFAFPTPMQSRERTIQKQYICASKLERLITGKTCVEEKRVPAKNSIAISSLHNALLSSAERSTTDLTALPIMNWRWLVFKVHSSFLSDSIIWHSILLSFEAIFFMVHRSTCWAVLAGSAFEFMEGDTIWCWVYVRRCTGTGSGSKNLQGMFCPYFKTYGQTL